MNSPKLSQEEKETIFEQIQKDLAKRNRQRHIRLYLTISAVACVALLWILLYPLFSVHKDNVLPEDYLLMTVVDSNALNQKDIQLVLSNNKTIIFDKNTDIKHNDIVNIENEQVKTSETTTNEITLNTLIVPKGKRSSLTLTDGSKVWINSGSILKFPTQFNPERREIWIEGEIYIEVEKNEAWPFYVNTSRMTVDVVGTQFNVSAYKDDTEHSVVLVEGYVDVSVNEKKSRLLPSQMLSVQKNNVSIEKIDVYDYISWRDGYLQFSNESLSHILTRLSRYYDIPIDYEESIAMMECNGKLVLFDEIEEVLKTIYNTLPIKYSLEENRILVQKR